MLYQDRRALSKLDQTERRLFNKGFPAWAVRHGSNTRPLVFQDYNVGSSTPRMISAINQKKLIESTNGVLASRIVTFYSETSDHEAFRAAGYMACRLLDITRSIECISAMDIMYSWRDIPKAMAYFVYGIDDNMAPGMASAVRSFLYARDGSLRCLIVAGNGEPRGPWDIVGGKLHVATEILFVMSSEADRCVNSGKISKSVTSKNIMTL